MIGVLNWFLAFLIISQPTIYTDARSIADKSVEYGIGYNFDNSAGFKTTSFEENEFYLDPVNTELIRDGGYFIHNHPYRTRSGRYVCPTFSPSDIMIAATMNLRAVMTTTRVNGRLTVYFAIRNITGWNLKAMDASLLQQFRPGRCAEWNTRWKQLAPSLGFTYVVVQQ